MEGSRERQSQNDISIPQVLGIPPWLSFRLLLAHGGPLQQHPILSSVGGYENARFVDVFIEQLDGLLAEIASK